MKTHSNPSPQPNPHRIVVVGKIRSWESYICCINLLNEKTWYTSDNKSKGKLVICIRPSKSGLELFYHSGFRGVHVTEREYISDFWKPGKVKPFAKWVTNTKTVVMPHGCSPAWLRILHQGSPTIFGLGDLTWKDEGIFSPLTAVCLFKIDTIMSTASYQVPIYQKTTFYLLYLPPHTQTHSWHFSI